MIMRSLFWCCCFSCCFCFSVFFLYSIHCSIWRLLTHQWHAKDTSLTRHIIYTLYFRQQFLKIKWNKAIRCTRGLGCNRRKNILWEKINIFGKRLTENRICQSRNGSFLGQFFQLILNGRFENEDLCFISRSPLHFFFLFTLAFWN